MRNDPTADLIPVLEIGGTHLASALVRRGTWCIIPGSTTRHSFDASGSAAALIDAMVETMNAVPPGHGQDWVVAIPGPFDYAAGIGQYEHVGKFDSLRGVNVAEQLSRRLGSARVSLRFLNDADAFGVGEYAVGAARATRRVACITLGTGVGSAFLDNGEPVNSGDSVPPHGSVHLLEYRGYPLEETVSRRAIRASYAATTGQSVDEVPDVRELADLSRAGNTAAADVLSSAFAHLGAALAPAMNRFQATTLVVGGSMAKSWDIVEPALRAGLSREGPALAALSIRRAERAEESALIGAAFWCDRQERAARI